MQSISPDHQHELCRFADTLAVVADEQRKLEARLGITDGKDRAITVSDDGSTDAVVQQRVLELNLRTLHQLRLSRRSPYFARLDFTPDAGPAAHGLAPGVKTSVYIGRWGIVQTPDYRIWVTDWRSPVANLYYSGQVGRVSYDAPDGTVAGELSLKRMFTVEDGVLCAMQDTGIAGQERFLAEALSQPATARLREVVTTIQAEQNAVMRHAWDKPLCVQGVAGSGKTTIALHRIAWLLYHLQKQISPSQLLILAPNPLFLSYISRVLPDLGVDAVRQTTFAGLCAQLMGKRMPRLAAADPCDDARAQLIGRKKGAASLAAHIDGFLAKYRADCLPTQDVMLGGSPLMTVREIHDCFFAQFRYSPLETRVQKTHKVMQRRLAQRLAKAGEKLAAMVDEKLSRLLAVMPDGPERRARATELFAIRDRRLEEMRALEKTVMQQYKAQWGSMDLLTVYSLFWQYMAQADPSCACISEAVDAMTVRKRALPADLPILLLLCRELHGIARMDVRHVVVDEAQDASPLQVRALREVFGHDAFTLVGDMCQGIYGGAGLQSWSELDEGVFAQPVTLTQLTTSYRSTVEITRTANLALARHPVAGVRPANPVLRHGPKPHHIHAQNREQWLDAIHRQVADWQAEGFGTIAVIARTPKAVRMLARSLPDAHVLDPDDIDMPGGVQLICAAGVKGLEFDCVLVADATAEAYPDDPHHARLMYVLCTRALHRLCILCTGDPTPLLPPPESC